MHHNVVEFCGEETNSSFILCSVLWILAEGLSEGHKAFKSDFSLGWTGHGDVLFVSILLTAGLLTLKVTVNPAPMLLVKYWFLSMCVPCLIFHTGVLY